MYAIIENWNNLTEQEKQNHIDASSAYIGGIASPRLSLDGTKALLKKADGAYTLEQIKIQLAGPDWTEEPQPPTGLEKRLERERFAQELLRTIAVDNEVEMNAQQFADMYADTDFATMSTLLAPHVAATTTAFGAISQWETKTWITDARRDTYKLMLQRHLESIGEL